MASDILNSLIFPTVFALTLVAVFTNRAAELFRLFGYLALIGPAVYTAYCVYDTMVTNHVQSFDNVWTTLSTDRYVIAALVFQVIFGAFSYILIKHANNH